MRSSIPGATLSSSVVSQIGEFLKPHLLPTLRSVLEHYRAMRTQTGQDRPTESQSEADLRRAIADGGTWSLGSGRVTDARGIETSFHERDRHDLSFVDNAIDLSLNIGLFAVFSGGPKVHLELHNAVVNLEVEAPEDVIEAIHTFVRELLVATVPLEASVADHKLGSFKVFIAYGGGRAWEVVRDYLQQAGFEVDAFTEEERAGQLTLDVVEEMIRSASAAVIVMTAADRMESGAVHARQNVVHEAGFAQGAIGRRNTIILREAGVTLPTNVDGLTYIQFEIGEIHTTRDRVVNLVGRLEAQQHQRRDRPVPR